MKKLFVLIIALALCVGIFVSSFFVPDTVTASSGQSAVNEKVIIIDAGHGGIDGGASTDDGVPEKDINLRISLYLDEYLRAFGYKTLLTRPDDNSLETEGSTIRAKKTSDLHYRMKLMEETDNALFISIHQNHFSVEKYYGTQVFYSPDQNEESSRLAQSIQSTVVETLQPENKREIKQCGSSVYLIYNAVKPAVLVECGFLSNKSEAEKLKTDEYQRKIAFCIAMGIINYLRNV